MRAGFIRPALVSLALAAAGCTPHAAPKAPGPPTAVQKPTADTPLPESIRWTMGSAEHDAAFVQTYRAATRRVEDQSAGKATGTWAVVLDADETILDNAVYQLERFRAGLGFTPESWKAWVQRKAAKPLPGAGRFLNRVRELGGRIAIVTNRLLSECEDTIAVFRQHQLVFDAMLCRPDKEPSDKNPRFRAVAAGLPETGNRPLDVVAFIGDNILDFPSLSQTVKTGGEAAMADFGRRYFLLPNPMYGSWP